MGYNLDADTLRCCAANIATAVKRAKLAAVIVVNDAELVGWLQPDMVVAFSPGTPPDGGVFNARYSTWCDLVFLSLKE